MRESREVSLTIRELFTAVANKHDDTPVHAHVPRPVERWCGTHIEQRVLVFFGAKGKGSLVECEREYAQRDTPGFGFRVR